MSKSSSRLPLSVANILLVSIFLVGAVTTAVLHNWIGTGLLTVLGLGGLGGAIYARRAGSRDITRINAIEYRDERDRMLARNGFAVVGAVALALSVVELVVATVLTSYYFIASIQLFILTVTWVSANSRAVRES